MTNRYRRSSHFQAPRFSPWNALLLAIAATLCLYPSAGYGGTAHNQQESRQAPNRMSHRNPYGNPYTPFLRQPFGVLPEKYENMPPVVDHPNEPFGYYRSPLAALGVFGGIENTMITPQGDLQTDFGTLLFYTGEKLAPLDQRIKTWRDGWLPIGEVSSPSDGVTYHIEYFDHVVPGVTKIQVTRSYGVHTHLRTVHGSVDNMVTFVKITATNTSNTQRTAEFGVGLGPKTIFHPVFRGSARPAIITFDKLNRALGGEGKLLFTVSSDPTTVAGGSDHVLAYQKALEPGASYSIVVKMPYWVAETQDLKPIESASYAAALSATESFWRDKLSRTGISIPEKKVENAYKANIVQLLEGSLNIIGNHWFLTGNPTIYKRFYMRDSAFYVDALLKAGFTNVVRHTLVDYPAWQSPDGRYIFVDSPSEYDSNGEALWSIGRYYEVTRDKGFARQMLPSVQASMAWQWKYRKDDWAASGGLYPVNYIGDDEQVRGHIVGFNLWAIAGGKAAIELARGAGDNKDAGIWAARMSQYTGILKQKIQPEFDRLHVVSPATEGMHAVGLVDGWYGKVYGIDWGNMQLVWPGEVFSAQNPMVTSSIEVWRKRMFEGMMGYPHGGDESFLHTYAPLSIPEAAFRGGQQLEAIRYLYNELAHTSSMDMTSEGINAAGRWGWHPSTVTMPHNTFSAEYVSLVRDMLAYGTYDGTLYLANAYSPEWTRPGQELQFSGPTRFGPAAYKITITESGMTIHLSPPTRNPPAHIVISTPQDTEIKSVQVGEGGGGNAQTKVKFKGNRITLPGGIHPVTLTVSWHRTATPPAYSFHRAVQDFLADYRQMTQPPALSVQNLAVNADKPKEGSGTHDAVSVEENAPVVVSALLVNHGGAGRISPPVVTLYEDGKPSAVDKATLAKGVGFDTPSSVISFRRHMEGRIPVSFVTRFAAPGKHTVGIGVGNAAPGSTFSVTVTPSHN